MSELVIAILGGSGAATVVSGIIQIIIWKMNRKAAKEDKNETKDDHVKTALKLLMYDRIKYLGKCYVVDGFIDAEDLRDIMAMHACYHNDLNGNGFLDSVMKQVKNLPMHK